MNLLNTCCIRHSKVLGAAGKGVPEGSVTQLLEEHLGGVSHGLVTGVAHLRLNLKLKWD